MAVTTWNTAPDYDTWGPDSWWDCMDWIQWHRLLKQKFGKEKAKIAWEYAYAKSGMGSGNLDCRTFNSNFRSYIAENNLDPFANAGVFSPILKGYGALTDIASSVTDLFTGKKGKIVVYSILGLAAIYVIHKGYKIIKTPKVT